MHRLVRLPPAAAVTLPRSTGRLPALFRLLAIASRFSPASTVAGLPAPAVLSLHSARHYRAAWVLPRVATALAILTPGVVRAQDAKTAIDPVSTTVVTVDLAARTLTPSLPFARRVVLRGKIPERTVGKDSTIAAAVIVLRVRRHGTRRDDAFVCESWSNEQLGNASALLKSTDFHFAFVATETVGKSIDTTFSVLPPHTEYDLEFLVGTSTTGAVVPAPDLNHNLCIDRFADLFPAAVRTDSIVINASTGGTVEDHFKLDIGLLVSDRARYTSGMSAVHLYSIPVDRGADLDDPGLGTFGEFRSRFSVFGGLAVLRLDRRGTVEAPRDLGALITGIGIRSPFYGYCVIPGSGSRGPHLCWRHGREALQPMRLNVGWIFLQQKDANPAITDNHGFTVAFIGLSFDTEVKSILGPLAGFLK